MRTIIVFSALIALVAHFRFAGAQSYDYAPCHQAVDGQRPTAAGVVPNRKSDLGVAMETPEGGAICLSRARRRC